MNRLKFLLVSSAVALGTLVSLNSCKNDDVLSEHKQEQTITKTVTITPSNPQNKYDAVGLKHNEALYKIFGLTLHKNSTRALGTPKATPLSVACHLYASPNSTEEDIKAEETKIKTLVTPEQYKQNFPSIVSSIEDKVVAKNVSEIIEYLTTSTKEGKVKSYEDFKNLVLAKENNLLADKTLTEEQKEVLLSMTSVFRYSAYLWSNQNGVSSARGFWSFLKEVLTSEPFKWVASGIADGVGGVVKAGEHQKFSVEKATETSAAVKDWFEKQ